MRGQQLNRRRVRTWPDERHAVARSIAPGRSGAAHAAQVVRRDVCWERRHGPQRVTSRAMPSAAVWEQRRGLLQRGGRRRLGAGRAFRMCRAARQQHALLNHLPSRANQD